MSIRNTSDADSGQVRRLKYALADDLSSKGYIHTPAWRKAFERVPRHVFVPRFFLDREHTGRYEPVDGSNPGQHDEWLTSVYSDETLITQLDGTDCHGVAPRLGGQTVAGRGMATRFTVPSAPAKSSGLVV